MSISSLANVESYFERRLGKSCLVVPSGRLAIYVALKHSLANGAKLLMSPVNDDVIFFTVLAAGVQPVMAPIFPQTGNIDFGKISQSLWSEIDGILTTNLHGIPDDIRAIRDMSQEYNVTLIEDAAHAFGISAGDKLIGSFGQYAAFSFSKHLNIPGGALCYDDLQSTVEIREIINDILRPRPLLTRADEFVRPPVLRAMNILRIRSAVQKIRAQLSKPKKRTRIRWRMPVRRDFLQEAVENGTIDRFDPWLTVDGPDYRTVPQSGLASLFTDAVDEFERTKNYRVNEIKAMALHPAVPDAVEAAGNQPLLRVPFLIHDRDNVAKVLRQHKLSTSYIYDPPLDEYAGPQFCDVNHVSNSGRWWANHVLPIDPMQRTLFEKIVADKRIEIRAATFKE